MPTHTEKTPNTTTRTKVVSLRASNRPNTGSREEEQAAKSQAPTSVQPVEPEDAYLTGVSRSLQRRLLGLNVGGPRGQSKPRPETAPHPETVPGQHATGSFTDEKPEKVPAKEKTAKKG